MAERSGADSGGAPGSPPLPQRTTWHPRCEEGQHKNFVAFFFPMPRPPVGGPTRGHSHSVIAFCFLFWRPAHGPRAFLGFGLGSSVVPPGSTIADLETGSAQVLLLGRRRVTHFLDQSEWDSGAPRRARESLAEHVSAPLNFIPFPSASKPG